MPTLTSIAAQLYVADIQTSCNFFTHKLDFDVDFIYGDPPFYAQVTRDNAHLALRHVDQPVFTDNIREREQLLSASITLSTTAEIQQLFIAFDAAEVPFHQLLKREPWGALTFIIEDPDQNQILFAAPSDV